MLFIFLLYLYNRLIFRNFPSSLSNQEEFNFFDFSDQNRKQFMENCLSLQKTLALPSAIDHRRSLRIRRKFAVDLRRAAAKPSRLRVIAAAGARDCEFSSLNSPLGPRTPSARELVGVLQNHPQLFYIAAADELKRLADDRDAARERMTLGAGSPEASLHRYSFYS